MNLQFFIIDYLKFKNITNKTDIQSNSQPNINILLQNTTVIKIKDKNN
jgi:hypothetical protein